jgi:hypothetical protein
VWTRDWPSPCLLGCSKVFATRYSER